MRDPAPAILRRAIREVLENQIRDVDPPETKETFERLLAQGLAEAEVWRLLSIVVATEMFDVLKHGREFDLGRYVQRLRALPELLDYYR